MANTTPVMTYQNPTTGGAPKKIILSNAPLQAAWALLSGGALGYIVK